MTFQIVTEPIDSWPLPDTERWARIPLFPDYEASSEGRVRRATGGKGVRAGRVLREQPHHRGYRAVSIYRGGRRSVRTVHTLVYEAFVGPRPDGLEVNHIDGDKTNNTLRNLEGSTSSENKRHAVRTGLAATGERNGAGRLSATQVAEIKTACSAGGSQRAVARQFGISQGHVSAIVNGHRRQGAGLTSALGLDEGATA